MARAKVGEDGMNNTERAYSLTLEAQRQAGEIAAWRFEPIKFRIGNRCWYTPDFEVIGADGALSYHEVKGHWMDDARVKIKAAAHAFSDRRFIAVKARAKKHGGGWEIEEIQA
jgi:hypothetical protein